MTITESEFRRRLATALTGTGLTCFDEQGLAVSAVLAEARAAGLELAPEPALPERLEITPNCSYIVESMGYEDAPQSFLAITHPSGNWDSAFAPPAHCRAVLTEAVRRYNGHAALEARAGRLAAALGELLGTIETIKIFDMTVEQADRLRQSRAVARLALAEEQAEGGES